MKALLANLGNIQQNNYEMKTKNILTLLMSATVMSLTACNVSTIDIDNTPDVVEKPSTNPVDGQVLTFTTAADSMQTLKQATLATHDGSTIAPTTIAIDPAKRYQTIDGFGFAITYSTAYNLLKMSAEDRAELLKKIYSPTEGYGVSYARISIGCSDFSSREYTLCDKEGIENFALQSDETDYVIPVLKEILAINPNLKVIAAPWTAPRWMKVGNMETLTPHNEWTDGHVNPMLYDVYAQYFVKFVQEMTKQGIKIYAVSPQNEPLNKQNSASTYMPWDEEAEFVKALASEFKRNKLTTQIYVYDHNYDYSNDMSQVDYPIKVYNALGKNFEGSELVVGAAFHDYGGKPSELDDIHSKAPDKGLIFSETSIGTWNNGRQLSKRLVADMQNVALATVNRNCKAVLVWNLMLDTNMGPNLDGGCQTCFGAIDIDPNNYKKMNYNSHYFLICHLSAVVKPGAVRLGTSREPENKNIVHSQFVNPDGTYSAVILNTGDAAADVSVFDGKKNFMVSVPALGVVSCIWK